MEYLLFIVTTYIFYFLQYFIFNNSKKKLLRYILFIVLLTLILTCILIYFNTTKISSRSVIYENREFAKYISTLSISGLIGCIFGNIFKIQDSEGNL